MPNNSEFNNSLKLINDIIKKNINIRYLEEIKSSILEKNMTEEQKKIILKKIDNYIYSKRNDVLIITIGKYDFELVTYYPNQEERRGLIKINSYIHDPTNSYYDIKTFYVYSSFSECGFWRLCMHKEIFEYGNFNLILDKGENDYVQEI